MNIKFFYGENSFAISRAIRENLTAKETEFSRTFNLSDDDSENILREICGMDLFASRKTFIIKNVLKKPDFAEKLIENCSQIPDENSIFLIDEKPDKRKKIFKDFAKTFETQEFAKLKDWELKSWLEMEIKAQKIIMKNDAQNELISRKIGAENAQDLIALELEKLSLLSDKNGEISIEKVREIVDENPIANTFSILNFAIIGDEKNREKIHSEINKMRKSGEDPNRFMGLLTSQIFAITAVIFNVPDAAKTLKINPFQLTKSREIIQVISQNNRENFAKKLTKKLAKTDAKLKLSNPENSWVLIEKFLSEIK